MINCPVFYKMWMDLEKCVYHTVPKGYTGFTFNSKRSQDCFNTAFTKNDEVFRGFYQLLLKFHLFPSFHNTFITTGFLTQG